jgi:hypothetical protein
MWETFVPGKVSENHQPHVLILKTLEKLLDRHMKDGVLAEKSLDQNQYAYTASISTERALFQGVRRPEKSLNYKEIALGAFLDIEDTFDTSFNAIITDAREHGLEETCCRWAGLVLCFKADWYTHPLWAAI